MPLRVKIKYIRPPALQALPSKINMLWCIVALYSTAWKSTNFKLLISGSQVRILHGSPLFSTMNDSHIVVTNEILTPFGTSNGVYLFPVAVSVDGIKFVDFA